MSDIEARVRDAIAMNVEYMDAPSGIVGRALAAVAQARRRRRRQRALVGALVVTVAIGAVAGVAVAARRDDSGITVTAGSSTTSQSSTPTSTPTTVPPIPSSITWNPACGPAPGFASVPGLRFTITLASPVVHRGGSTRAALAFANTTDHEIQFLTGVGAEFVTTLDGRVVGSTSGYPVILIGYGLSVPARGRITPLEPQGGISSFTGSCSGLDSSLDVATPPLPRGHYLAWFGVPNVREGMFLSEPVPFDIAGAPVWNVRVSREQAVADGRESAIDPGTANVSAKLASFAEIRDAGADLGSSPNDRADRRVWVVAVEAKPKPGMCCLTRHAPLRWGIALVDATTGERFGYTAGSQRDIAPWFAHLPDHGP